MWISIFSHCFCGTASDGCETNFTFNCIKKNSSEQVNLDCNRHGSVPKGCVFFVCLFVLNEVPDRRILIYFVLCLVQVVLSSGQLLWMH